jgi:signal transduction histidine kinase
LRSLRARLFVVWLLSLAASCAVGLLLLQLYRVSTTAQTGRADAALAQACERIADRYASYTTGWTPPANATQDAGLRRDLAAVVALALAGYSGIESGIIDTDTSAPLTELPAADRQRVLTLAQDAAASDQSERAQYASGFQTLLLRACPLHGPLANLAAWTMTRVTEAAGWDALRGGLGVLLALVVGLSGWLTWLVLAWTRHVGRIESALAGAGGGDLPLLPPTGEAELDRIIGALNTAGMRLAEARRRSAELSGRVAAAERLAALGRVAAGVAHEFRNPIAAMRLKAENALADPARREAALHAVLTQIARLDRLIGELLAMTQRREPAPAPLHVAGFLHAVAADHACAEISLVVEAADVTLPLDADLLRRTLDPLLDNARRHSPPGGTVTLRAGRCGDALRLDITDQGAGVAAGVRDSLFEPFVTGRADGTGLGLAIARELAQAQGGRLTLARPGGARHGEGAMFVLEIPCPPS